MILADIIQRVQSLYSKGVQSDDSRLTSRHIYNKLVTSRAKILTQKMNKKQRISSWVYQTIPYIEIQEVNRELSPCIVASGCKVRRSKNPLPKSLVNMNGLAIDYVMTLDDKIQFYETNRFEMIHIKGNKYTSKASRYLIDDDYYLYLFGESILPVAVKVRMVAEDPLTIFYLQNCSSDTKNICVSPFDMDFPLDADSVDTVIEMSAQELVTEFNQSVEDTKNDSAD